MSIPLDWFYTAFLLTAQFADEGGELLAPKTATGVCVMFPGRNAALIANRHFLDPTWRQPGAYDAKGFGHSIALLRMTGRPTRGSDELMEITIKSPEIFYSDTYSNDVALIPLKSLSIKANVSHVHIDRTLNFAALSRADEFGPNIRVADQVAFPGYSELNDATYDRPILRMGWIASDPAHGIKLPEVEGDAFLIEGFAIQGTSGSPVFAVQRGLRVGGAVEINDPSFRGTRLIGISAGYLSSSSHGHSQISYAFKSSVIWECASKAFGEMPPE